MEGKNREGKKVGEVIREERGNEKGRTTSISRHHIR